MAAHALTTSSGLEALTLSCDLLHRVRRADPRAGTWEAADLQWWWRVPRVTEDLQQPFVVDDRGPLATARLTAWSDNWGLDVMRAPEAGAAWREVAERAWQMSQQHGVAAVESLVTPNDRELIGWLEEHGFAAAAEDGTGWLPAADRPKPPVLPDGYRLVDRSTHAEGEHPLVRRNGPQVEHRLQQLPLYGPRLDLAVLAPDGDVAGYALFWNDAATRVGLVEPVRVEDAHSGRGLAFAMVAAGLDRLAAAGSTLLKVSWETQRARRLYVRLGFTDPVASTLYRWDRSAERLGPDSGRGSSDGAVAGTS